MDIDFDAVLREFLLESTEQLSALEQALLQLEGNAEDAEAIQLAFRMAHTFKGNASCVGFDPLASFAHELEESLDALRSGQRRASAELVTLLLRGVDALRQAVPAQGSGLEVPKLLAAFEAWQEQRRRYLAAAGAEGAPTIPTGSAELPAAREERADTLRVSLERLDRMLNLSGEALIARGRVQALLERRAPHEKILEAHLEANRILEELQEEVTLVRLVQVGPVLRQHHRTVRDLAALRDKQVRLSVEGEDVELDTAVLHQVRDPLLHLVRNAVDHGIEAPADRAAAGKEPAGLITLRAFRRGAYVQFEVEDDGAGFSLEAIRRRAQERGIEASRLSEDALQQLVFEPGFSTASQVDLVSGRGVGLDVVRRNVEALRGSVSLHSQPGRGARIALRVPLTLAVIQGFSVGVGEEVLVLPLDGVLECLELPPAQADGRRHGVLHRRGQPLPYLRLRRLLELEGEPPERESVVVVRTDVGEAGLVVDRLLGESQIVIKPLGPVFEGSRGVSGAAIQSNGAVALILDVATILRDVVETAAREAEQTHSNETREDGHDA